MNQRGWTLKILMLVAAIASLACVVAVAATGMVEPVSNATLGPDWQCSRLALVWTTCHRQKHVQATSAGMAGEPACLRRRA